jgi:hypothetical protein
MYDVLWPDVLESKQLCQGLKNLCAMTLNENPDKRKGFSEIIEVLNAHEGEILGQSYEKGMLKDMLDPKKN